MMRQEGVASSGFRLSLRFALSLPGIRIPYSFGLASPPFTRGMRRRSSILASSSSNFLAAS
ncbi:hypothetical protein CERZMDRAFT_90614 [Cercospora zeae-maydis SCOH1-5]|uniref:Uncharacterized protein n=1 Tax=Cercospora zeae-maydis SCOH1-5 TaxID=717836 RepID=A0A6A6FIV1_9PEZI|nr:hypothetical protein CERZMDRAFT_90614 [Cercospora zeae-maydis SCOH1-5]